MPAAGEKQIGGWQIFPCTHPSPHPFTFHKSNKLWTSLLPMGVNLAAAEAQTARKDGNRDTPPPYILLPPPSVGSGEGTETPEPRSTP